MAVMNVNPTRMQLTKLRKQLATATRGHKMLKDKRDELMRRFLDLVRENKELREKIERELAECNNHFVNASAVMSKEALDASLMSPKQRIDLELSSKNVMSVDDAVMSLNELLPDLIRLAEIEKSCELMSAEIEKTRRRVNSLEHVMIPRYQETIKYISMKLEENDRSSRTRLMKVKDMLLDKAHHYSEHYN